MNTRIDIELGSDTCRSQVGIIVSPGHVQCAIQATQFLPYTSVSRKIVPSTPKFRQKHDLSTVCGSQWDRDYVCRRNAEKAVSGPLEKGGRWRSEYHDSDVCRGERIIPKTQALRNQDNFAGYVRRSKQTRPRFSSIAGYRPAHRCRCRHISTIRTFSANGGHNNWSGRRPINGGGYRSGYYSSDNSAHGFPDQNKSPRDIKAGGRGRDSSADAQCRSFGAGTVRTNLFGSMGQSNHNRHDTTFDFGCRNVIRPIRSSHIDQPGASRGALKTAQPYFSNAQYNKAHGPHHHACYWQFCSTNLPANCTIYGPQNSQIIETSDPCAFACGQSYYADR